MSASRIHTALSQLTTEVGSFEETLLKLIQVKKTMTDKSVATGNANKQLRHTSIAIVGMASIFPKARYLQDYWTNIVRKVDCITEVPASHWNIEDYYDPDPKAPDKTYCKRGGFIPDIEFNPLEFGLPPNILEVTDTSQLLGLVVAKEAMEDAGYGESREFNRDRTGVVLGVALAKQLSVPLAARLQYPIWQKVLTSSGLSEADTQKVIEKLKLAYVKWEENAFPGMLANVVAGRIANRLNLGGMNCVVDAACASSLGALRMAISELVEHRCDMMLTGGVDTDNSSLAYLCFSKTPALSRSQQVKPFDAESDGMMLGEGIGMVVLKRLEDAERDGDRIYAVIQGIGTSSDGRFKSIYAPRPEGQIKALQRAYEDAGISPTSVGLIEAHGTGTVAGDPAEFSALKAVFNSKDAAATIALGSVKSQIGHTKAAAGAASLIKAALALHQKVLPPTINVSQPNPKLNLDDSAFYINTEVRPWIRTDGQPPRRAGVSSFGFGGTNYHVVLEEYTGQSAQKYRLHQTPQPVILFAETPEKLLAHCESVLEALQSSTGTHHYHSLIKASQAPEIPPGSPRLGFVASDRTEGIRFIQVSIELLKSKPKAEFWEHPQGIVYRKQGLELNGKVVALFSGQGSQYVDMGRELVMNFPPLQQMYSHMDGLLMQDGLQPLSQVVFPPPAFDAAQKQAQSERLQQTEYAQPAIGMLSAGLYKLLQEAGFQADFIAGHSFGELTALWAAGVLSDADYCFLVKSRGQAMAAPADPNYDTGAMLAVKESQSRIEPLIQPFPVVTIANFNSNRQVVLAGPTASIHQVQQVLKDEGISVVVLPVSAAFHTPMIEHALKAFAQASEAVTFHSPTVPVYTNVTAAPYPTEPAEIQRILEVHLSKSVLFKQQIENIYAAGGFCFVEFGPRNILSNLVNDILADRPHLTIALNASRQKDSDRQLREAVVKLQVAGLNLRNFDPYQLEQPEPQAKPPQGLQVYLNGTNYVSEKTKQAFEKALREAPILQPAQVAIAATQQPSSSHPTQPTSAPPAAVISANGNGSKPSTIQNGSQNRLGYQNKHAKNEQHASLRSASDGHANGNGHVVAAAGNAAKAIDGARVQYPSPSSSAAMTPDPLDSVSTQSSPQLDRALNSQSLSYRLLESLENNLAQFRQLQGDTLNVHGQYLNHQIEYARTFFQLMQQQNTLLNDPKFVQQTPSSQQTILQGLERSISQFHDHQAETLRLHEHYLSHQVEHTQQFCQLTQEQYSHLVPTERLGAIARSLLDQPSTYSSSFPVVHPTPISPTPSDSIAKAPPAPTIVHVTDPPAPAIVPSAPPVTEPHLPISPPTWEAPVLPTAPAVPVQPAPEIVPGLELPDAETLGKSLLAIVSDKTGYPTEMLEMDMDMEADLGIDSIKRVEILGAIQEQYPELPKAEPEALAELRTLGQIVAFLHTHSPSAPVALATPIAPAAEMAVSIHATVAENSIATSKLDADQVPDSSPAPNVDLSTNLPDAETLGKSLLAIVSDKTGYPAEMLEMDMDMEADLGIDSIKRVEILGAIQEQYPALPKAEPEALAELRTLGQIVAFLEQPGGLLPKKSQSAPEESPPS